MINPRERRDILLCHPMNQNVVRKWPWPIYVQPKLEGDRIRAVWDPNIGYVLYTSTARPILFLPHINKALNNLNITEELDGEAYNHSFPHEMIHGIVSRTVNIHRDYKRVEFHVFDLVDETMPFRSRTKWLHDHIEESEEVQLVNTATVFDMEEVMTWYEEYIEAGYEGIIVRHPEMPYVRKRTPFVRKFKPLEVDTYLCVGVNEEYSMEGIAKNRMGSVTLMDADKKTFNCGGWTDYQKDLYWKDPQLIIGHLVRVRYQQLTEKGVPKMISHKEVIN